MTDIDITPGQIWAWNASVDADESPFRIMTVDANRVRYQYLRGSDPHIEGGFIHTPATIREQCYLVTDVDATPAPLDPAKVKAGDTVTVRVEEFDIPDPYEVTGKAYVGPIGMAVGGFLLSGDRVTLTAHQPAPEPEPLVEGRLYEVTAPDGRRGRAFYKPIDGIRANHPWVSEDETRYRSDAVTDVRPLVVIDPANGWWAEIHNALVAAGIGDAGSAATIALATLGIEATS